MGPVERWATASLESGCWLSNVGDCGRGGVEGHALAEWCGIRIESVPKIKRSTHGQCERTLAAVRPRASAPTTKTRPRNETFRQKKNTTPKSSLPRYTRDFVKTFGTAHVQTHRQEKAPQHFFHKTNSRYLFKTFDTVHVEIFRPKLRFETAAETSLKKHTRDTVKTFGTVHVQIFVALSF